MELHEVVQQVQALAVELGRTPIMDEFANRYGKGDLRRIFGQGAWCKLLAAAGLEPHRQSGSSKPTKITNEVFRVDLEAHLEKYQPKEYKVPGPFPRAAIISDIHWPFQCDRVVSSFVTHCEKAQPEWILLNGDGWDMYSHARFPRSHNLFTPREEEKTSRRLNEEFWKILRQKCPESKLVQMLGNHDVRPAKQALAQMPMMEDWITRYLQDLFTFDGVKTMMDPREELFLDEETIVHHGHASQLGAHRDYTGLNCFIGHTHRGGVVWRTINGRLRFESNSGYAGDPFAKGLSYTPQKLVGWTQGFTRCDELGPSFVPA